MRDQAAYIASGALLLGASLIFTLSLGTRKHGDALRLSQQARELHHQVAEKAATVRSLKQDLLQLSGPGFLRETADKYQAFLTEANEHMLLLDQELASRERRIATIERLAKDITAITSKNLLVVRERVIVTQPSLEFDYIVFDGGMLVVPGGASLTITADRIIAARGPIIIEGSGIQGNPGAPGMQCDTCAQGPVEARSESEFFRMRETCELGKMMENYGKDGGPGSPGGPGANVRIKARTIEGELICNVKGGPGGSGGMGGSGRRIIFEREQEERAPFPPRRNREPLRYECRRGNNGQAGSSGPDGSCMDTNGNPL